MSDIIDYPFIRAAGILHGSKEYYVEQVLDLARKDNAPDDAWSYSGGTATNPTAREWHTISALESRTDEGASTAHYTASRLRQIVADYVL